MDEKKVYLIETNVIYDGNEGSDSFCESVCCGIFSTYEKALAEVKGREATSFFLYPIEKEDVKSDICKTCKEVFEGSTNPDEFCRREIHLNWPTYAEVYIIQYTVDKFEEAYE